MRPDVHPTTALLLFAIAGGALSIVRAAHGANPDRPMSSIASGKAANTPTVPASPVAKGASGAASGSASGAGDASAAAAASGSASGAGDASAAVAASGSASGAGAASGARAASGAGAARPERTEISVTSSTYLRFFQRALLPGPAGAQVTNQTLAPVYEYFTLRGQRAPAPWGGEVSVELSGWGNGLLNNIPGENRFDGDVSVFLVQQQFRRVRLRMGRQVITGGAARLSRIDGVSSGIVLMPGLQLDVYGGLQVLPRWSQRPGYQQLGSATDALIRSHEWIADPNRGGYAVWGARASYQHAKFGQIGMSFHEAREQSELGRRDVAADVVVLPRGPMTVTGLFLLDLDSRRFSEARAAADFTVSPELSFTGEYRRAEPSLFLSRQSVLSVFSTANYDELGGEIRYRPLHSLMVHASGYLDSFEGGDRGVRGSLRLQANPTPRLLVQTVIGRVAETENGYWTVRASFRYQWPGRISTVAEHNSYFYDKPIRGFGTSTVDAGNVEWGVLPQVRLLVGVSASRSPYAALDTQGLVRVVCAWDRAGGAGQ